MEALWRDHYYGRKLGLTLKEIAASLPSTTNLGQQLSIPAIRDNLKTLSELSLIVLGDVVFRGKGRPAEVVRLDVERVITWPTTAAIVLTLFNRQGSMCPRESFFKDILALGLIDPDGNPQSPDVIARQISFATSIEYLGTVPSHDNVVTCKDRVWQEYNFLQFLSDQTKPSSSGPDRPFETRA